MEEFILKYWMEAIFTGAITFVGVTYKKIKKRFEEQDKKSKAMENGVQALLRNELIKNFREHKINGEITLLDKENMQHMFEEYFNLGGNGMMHDIYKEFQELETKIVK